MIYTVTFNPQYRDKISKDNLKKMQISDPDVYSRYVETTEIRVFRADMKECV